MFAKNISFCFVLEVYFIFIDCLFVVFNVFDY